MKNYKSYFLVLILSLYTSSLIFEKNQFENQLNNSQINQANFSVMNNNQMSYQSPVVITSDTELAENAVKGSGNDEDPYIIENLKIKAYISNGIYITGTTKHFVIRNCVIDCNFNPNNNCIFLDDIATGTSKMLNNICANASTGIYLEKAPNSYLTNNSCMKNLKRGIWLYRSPNSTIINNNCINNTEDGIAVQSEFCQIFNNFLRSNGNGINAFGDDPVYIYENTCVNNTNGIKVRRMRFCSVLKNLVVNNSEYGIIISDVSNFNIENNIFSRNTIGIYLMRGLVDFFPINQQLLPIEKQSNEKILENRNFKTETTEKIRLISINTCEENINGIVLPNESRCVIIRNNIIKNKEYGIIVNNDADDNIIHHNNFISNNNIPQAFDEGTNNTWFDVNTKQGNYWSDHGKDDRNIYIIAGISYSNDTYPLSKRVDLSNSNFLDIFLPYFPIIFIIFFEIAILVTLINYIKSKKIIQE